MDEDHGVAARRALIKTLLIEVGLPLAVYYGLREADVPAVVALLIAAAVPLLRAGFDLARGRRPSGFALFVLASLVLTALVTAITGSPRLLLTREAWLSGILGVWVLASLLGGHPFLYYGARALMPEDKRDEWDRNWNAVPPFRRLLRILTAIWGTAFVLASAAKVVLAMTLPIDAVPAWGNAVFVAALVLVLAAPRVWGRPYLCRHGWRLRGVHLSRTNGGPT